MNDITIEFPADFDDYSWEVQSKGWFPGVVAVIHGHRYRLTVYDPTRLTQDIEDALEKAPVFLERNLLVVPSVTRECIVSAIQEIVQAGMVGDLRPDECDPR